MPNEMGIEEQIILALRRLTRAVDIHSSSLQKGYGLTGPQLTALRVIKRLQPVPTGEVARSANIGHATLTGILDRLEDNGYITRTRMHADRRTVIVSLSQSGDKILASAPSLLQDRLRKALAKMPDSEQAGMVKTLVRIASLMETEAPVSGRKGAKQRRSTASA